jgi:hypothetical protein
LTRLRGEGGDLSGEAGRATSAQFAEAPREHIQGFTSWGFLLVVFMRLLAVIWVIQGLLHWSAVLLPPEALFDQVPVSVSAAVVFFAIFDLVAAVGLWLASPWGGAIWLFVALAQILVAVTVPDFFSTARISVDILLVAVYFYLTWQAGHSALYKS